MATPKGSRPEATNAEASLPLATIPKGSRPAKRAALKALPFGVREVETPHRWVGPIPFHVVGQEPPMLAISPDGRVGQLAVNADGQHVIVVPVFNPMADPLPRRLAA